MTLLTSPHATDGEEKADYTLANFFEDVPPGARVEIFGKLRQYENNFVITAPTIQLFCTHEHCNGIRFFDSEDTVYTRSLKDVFVDYRCRNCKDTTKTFAVRFIYDKDAFTLSCQKFGEFPYFGPPTPSRVRSLVGNEGDYYNKGMRSESQSLGIAAFAYYRRIVEHQKDRIFDEIIKVAERLNESKELIAQLQSAKKESQFTAAVDGMKLAIPQVLMIDGHNPLTLLHSALSEGLHAQSDQECLELATSIRVVLTEFVDRVGIALKNEAELKTAVSRLFKKLPPKTAAPGNTGAT